LNILHTVEQYYPSVGGMQEVVKQISERLVELGHEVTVATSYHKGRSELELNGVHIEQFNIKGRAIEKYEGKTNEYQDYLVNSKFDVVVNFAAQQWATDLMLPILDKITAKKVFVPTGFSALYNDAFKDYYQSMKAWMKQYDMNVFLSDDYRDINFARENGIENNILIPNGADEREFSKEYKIDIRTELGIPEDHFLILNVGSHTGIKGHKEAIQMFKHTKLKNVALLIIANSFDGGCSKQCSRQNKRFNKSVLRQFDRKKLIVTSLSREDTVAAYQQADLFLFPSNIECSPIVLFECMASKTPFLTSDVGNSIEITKWSQSGLVLPTMKNNDDFSFVEIKKSIKMLEQLVKDESTRKDMAEKGYVAWSREFTWKRIAEKYETLYGDLINKE
jgi:L-malate glycosyltransferase